MKKKRAPSPRQQAKKRPQGQTLQKLETFLIRATFLALVVLPPLVVTSGTKENFRLPKLLLCSFLALVTLWPLALRLRRVERVDFKALMRHPVILSVVPLLAVATLTLLFTAHPAPARQAVGALWVAVVALCGWSFGLREGEHRWILRALMLPATILSVVAIVQHHELAEVFRFKGVVQERIGVTSFAGSAFDLSAYLVLPALLAQARLFAALGKRDGNQRWTMLLWGVGLVLWVYVIAITQTLSTVGALGIGSLFLWMGLLERKKFIAGVALAAVLGVLAVAVVSPLRDRVVRKAEAMRGGAGLNHLLTGRLDGWRAATWMFEQNPLMGVGHGAYRAEFGHAKLALREEGYRFYRFQHQTYFTNAHSEPLEVAAEWGLLGCLALLWGLWQLAAWLRRRPPLSPVTGSAQSDRALVAAGLAALTVMSLVNFPLRVALVAYPYLLFFSWIFIHSREVEE